MKSTYILALSALVLISCGDDEGGSTSDLSHGGIKEVFAYDAPKKVAGLYDSMKCNEKGKVTKVTNKSDVTEFEYIGDNKVIMTVTAEGKTSTSEMTIDVNRFVSECYQTTTIDGVTTREEWRFKYNDANQLIYIARPDKANEKTNIEYENGDIVSLSITDNLQNKTQSIVSYTNKWHPNIISNKYGIMLFKDVLGIDLGDLEIAYYAGLLGKPTKNLPVVRETKISKYKQNPINLNWELSEFKETCNYGWELKGDKPTRITLPQGGSISIGW